MNEFREGLTKGRAGCDGPVGARPSPPPPKKSGVHECDRCHRTNEALEEIKSVMRRYSGSSGIHSLGISSCLQLALIRTIIGRLEDS